LSIHARILIVAREDDRAGPIADGLDVLGWKTVTARGPFAAIAALGDLQIEAAIVDLIGGGREVLSYARRLKAACSPRRLPVIAIGDPDPQLASEGYDLALAPPVHPAQAAMRIESLVRMAVAEEEFELRLETFAENGRRLELPETAGGPPRILCVGEPAPQFLALSNALSQYEAQVVGAFTSYTAFDYLHERAFDAVVLWADQNEQEALAIVAGLRRNTRLYHIPALLYLRGPPELVAPETFLKGVTDVVPSSVSESDAAKRVLELARAYRRQTAIRRALEKARGSGLMDAATGLFTRDLFAAHLMRLASAARSRNRPLSVCVLKIAEQPHIARARASGWLDRAIPQIGSMLGRLIRVEDTAARLGPEVFALALPATNAAAGRRAVERIAAVIGCTAFESGQQRKPFVAEFDIGVAEVTAHESAAKALEAAAAKAMRRAAG
jgi:two-component system cell cycle response regulator PopA